MIETRPARSMRSKARIHTSDTDYSVKSATHICIHTQAGATAWCALNHIIPTQYEGCIQVWLCYKTSDHAHTHKHTYAWRTQVKYFPLTKGNRETTTTNWYPTHTYTRTYMCRRYETCLKGIYAETPLWRSFHKTAIRMLILLTHMSDTCL
jgi:hypothetical protein